MPLGSDEFGRDILSVSVASGINSLIFGMLCASASLAIALVISFVLTFMAPRAVAAVVDGAVRVVDGVPVVLWVLMLALLAPSAARTSAALTLLIAVLPYLVRLSYGQFELLKNAPYVDAARMQELPSWRLTVIHLLPNSWSILGPAFAQVCGLAVAVDGAIALVGSANRTELNLGVLLLRGKEQFGHPLLLVTALATMLVVYFAIASAGSRSGQAGRALYDVS
jgi:ABC-type dipeptide/oligopeptide/nickel transport system permease subunit